MNFTRKRKPLKIRISVIAGTLILAFAVSGISTSANADAGFKKWVSGFYSVARKSGISKATYQRAFKGITSADPEVLKKARYQPEFVSKIWQYMDARVNEDAVATGRAMKRKYANWLTRIEKRFGVDRNVLLAIWSMESSYGKALEKPGGLRSVIRSLSTLAYADRKRRKFARRQLIAALKILQSGQINTSHLTGSWAGAMGHTQFIPTSYQLYKIDMDGDGRKDIWSSIPDALATAANLLRKNGWRTGETWGYEVNAGRATGHKNKTKTLSQWSKLGVKRVKGRQFRNGGQKAVLKLFQGSKGPAFLMTKNFYVIKRYNNADKYALAVGHLADQIAGGGELAHDWLRPYKKLSWDENKELQRQLALRGLYSGEIDGKIGSGTRKAILTVQAQYGLKQDGYASKKLLSVLRRK